MAPPAGWELRRPVRGWGDPRVGGPWVAAALAVAVGEDYLWYGYSSSVTWVCGAVTGRKTLAGLGGRPPSSDERLWTTSSAFREWM